MNSQNKNPLEQNPKISTKHMTSEMVHELPELSEQVGWLEEDTHSYALDLVKEPLNLAKTMLITDPREYHGLYFDSEEVKTDSGLTSRINCIASLGNSPSGFIFFLALASQGFLTAFFSAIALTGLFTKANNDASTVLARRRRGNPTWLAGLLGVALLGGVQSSMSAIAVEAFNNGEALGSRYATQLVEQHQAKVSEISTDTQQFRELEELKRKLETEIARYYAMDSNDTNRNRDRLHIEIWGEFNDLNLDRSNVPFERLPLALKVERLQAEASAFKKEIEQEWQEKLERRHELGDDQLFLREVFPEKYERHFDENGELLSGIRLIEQASLNLAQKISEKDFAGLTFPLFFSSLSFITSLLSLLMSLLHASNEEIKMSWDEKVASAVEDEFGHN